ncbi:hypothetical protein BW16_05325 [Bacillus pumilus]|nr:hypothetical protein BW16_05325 [Bacillus pumilus]
MNNNKIEQLTNFLNGITLSEWNRVKQNVDILFSSKAAKVEFDDSELLKTNLKQEFRIDLDEITVANRITKSFNPRN